VGHSPWSLLSSPLASLPAPLCVPLGSCSGLESTGPEGAHGSVGVQVRVRIRLPRGLLGKKVLTMSPPPPPPHPPLPPLPPAKPGLPCPVDFLARRCSQCHHHPHPPTLSPLPRPNPACLDPVDFWARRCSQSEHPELGVPCMAWLEPANEPVIGPLRGFSKAPLVDPLPAPKTPAIVTLLSSGRGPCCSSAPAVRFVDPC